MMRDAGNGHRRGYRTVFIWKAEGSFERPLWALHVRKSEKYAFIAEWSTGRVLASGNKWFRKYHGCLRGPGPHKSKRLRIMAQVDLAIMAILAACLEDICDETFGRNLEAGLGRETAVST